MPRPEPPKLQRGLNCVPPAWLAEVDRRIAVALAKHDRVATAAVGQALAQIRQQLRDEIRGQDVVDLRRFLDPQEWGPGVRCSQPVRTPRR